ncbi:hypothetical protein [Mycoplasmopsis agassizii]|nr:hypothetical protein [Mycoplasmopsis agassizii]SMC17530.1 hypothetical protein SAMN02745179_00484 [Mycoplasmopsis agassizii]
MHKKKLILYGTLAAVSAVAIVAASVTAVVVTKSINAEQIAENIRRIQQLATDIGNADFSGTLEKAGQVVQELNSKIGAETTQQIMNYLATNWDSEIVTDILSAISNIGTNNTTSGSYTFADSNGNQHGISLSVENGSQYITIDGNKINLTQLFGASPSSSSGNNQQGRSTTEQTSITNSANATNNQQTNPSTISSSQSNNSNVNNTTNNQQNDSSSNESDEQDLDQDDDSDSSSGWSWWNWFRRNRS